MRNIRRLAALAAAIVLSGVIPSRSQNAAPTPPFQPHVDMQTFMEHVLTPAASVLWSVNAAMIDARGEHDLAPRTDEDWEKLVSAAATLAEATNALMIPQRAMDPAWNGYVKRLADAADKAYHAAENHDLKSISEVSDRLDGICSACHKHYGFE
ncbi:hypothetical protein [Bradyrhizobium sp. STM 3557]|uniref:hypothetical protein n=1 Tax=Bradyrhizobium sp. STM 3557 TaxID=578920 RepID=UPI00388D0513